MDAGIGRAAGVLAGALVLILAVAGVRAQDTAAVSDSAPAAAPPSSPAPPSPAAPAPDTAAPASPDHAAPPANVAATDEDDKPAPPAAPPTPSRAPSAVLRVLDKVTAETMAFEAPVRQRVRYKSLVFEVKACETRGVGDPQPQPSAYVVVTSDAGASAASALAARQIYKGWMFANAPSVHALTHPIYDAWLVSCGGSAG